MNNYKQDKNCEQVFWDRIATQRIYAAFDDHEYTDIFDKALAPNLSGKLILDVGCASGISAALLAMRGARVTGVDISPELIKQANELWQDFGDRLKFIVSDAEHLDLDESSVDYCFFGGVLHHFPDMGGVFTESLRVLKPGGKFLAVEPNSLDWCERVEWKVAGWRGKLSPNEFPINPNSMRDAMRTAGFNDVSFWNIRQDIPVLNQLPILKYFFNRQRGFWLKTPLLTIINILRKPDHRGTFFVIEGTKS